MTEHHLHIISFDIPYPPVYGGIIDVYYRIRALANAGVRITLHAFYKDKERSPSALEELCDNVFLYPRKMEKRKAVGTTPFIIASRRNDALIQRLMADNDPIFIEGMHSAAVLDHPGFRKRTMVLRMHNIEWDYYRALAAQEKDLLKKLYYRMEAYRLERSAYLLAKADAVYAISRMEEKMLSVRFPKCSYLPPFHGHQSVTSRTGKGTYALYHGNLAVVENQRAVEFLIRRVFPGLDLPLKIAGSNPPDNWLSDLKKEAENRVEFTVNPDDAGLSELIRDAQVNVLASFQETGVKLKLINALFMGRHCIVNPQMVKDSSLENVCMTAENAQVFQKYICDISSVEFTDGDIQKREEVLLAEFDDARNASGLIKSIFQDH